MACLLDADVFSIEKVGDEIDAVRRIRIPNACIALVATFVSPYEMLRHERARFVLGGRA